MNSEERSKKIEIYGGAVAVLEVTLEGIPRSAWKYRPKPGEWSIHEIVIHLADSETNAALRARRLVAEPGQPVMAYDQDVWARELNYHDQDPDEALKLVKYARLTTYQWLKTLPDKVFKNSVVHPEFDEPYTFEMWLNIYAAHIPDHVKQIKNNYVFWKNTR